MRPTLLIALVFLSCVKSPTGPVDLAGVTAGQSVEGFRAEAVYTDDRDAPMGGRFVHERTGFVLDLVRIPTAPQGYLWVRTAPDSDRGEPHTQEHLLLGKGNKGRSLGSWEQMSLVESSAFTDQIETVYHFHTSGDAPSFFGAFEHDLDAYLHPDYTDEEIRREVHHYGVAEMPDGTLHLEEKGTVYQEMVSSSTRPWYWMWKDIQAMLYGEEHPLARSSGGDPAAIRTMTAEHIRGFHAAHYHLSNMGLIAVLPPAVEVSAALATLGDSLDRLEPEAPKGLDATLPPPKPKSASATVQVVTWPSEDPSETGDVVAVWPAVLEIDQTDRLALAVFLETFGGTEASNLYRRFVDSTTRTEDLGASATFAFAQFQLGQPIYMGVEGVKADRLDEATGRLVRQRITEDLEALAAASPGTPLLDDFQRRAEAALVAKAREYRKFVDSPPEFGFRGSGTAWFDHLRGLATMGQFRRSLTAKDTVAAVQALFAAPGNPWRPLLARWRLVGTEPHVFLNKASPEMAKQLADERKARIDAEVETLRTRYGAPDAAAAIARFRTEYDAQTKELEAIASAAMPAFMETPPMTLDDLLSHRTTQTAGLPTLVTPFEGMSGGAVQLAIDVPTELGADELVYLALIADLLDQVGVVEVDGTVVTYAQMLERLDREVLSLDADTSVTWATGRLELVVTGSGTDLAETEAAVAWMRRILVGADWRTDNGARLRDLVDEDLQQLRNAPRNAEESWVRIPALAWRHPDARLLSAAAFPTRTYHALRLRWMLRDADSKATLSELTRFLERLAQTRGDRTALGARLAVVKKSEIQRLPPAARALAADAVADLEQVVADLPPDGVGFAAVCRQIAADLARPAGDALAGLDAFRDRLLDERHARLVVVGADATIAGLADDLEALAASLGEPVESAAQPDPVVFGRVKSGSAPVFVGLVHPDLQGGVVLNTAPSANYRERDPKRLERYLAGQLYAGHGAHGLFIKTWGAGLAYSNGLRPDVASGLIQYYAERCPEIPQTLGFVIGEIRKATPDPALVDYAVAQAFQSRSADTFEARAFALGIDLEDGNDPETVRAFREAILALRSDDGLSDRLFQILPEVTGQVLPGLGPSAPAPGAVYFSIGTEQRLVRYEEYLRSIDPRAQLVRLYMSDFWLPPA
jgi:Zn-dependent M16 (insulinase) family peptidase